MAVLSVAGRRIVSLMGLLLLLCTATVFAAPRPGSNDLFGCRGRRSIRREWRTLSTYEKKQFTDAVNCLLCKPGRTPRNLAEGVRSRYDDLVLTHQNQTFSIHYVGYFLPWHRYYTWTIEKMMRDECGFRGTFPYWAWENDCDNTLPDDQSKQKFLNSPIWDGTTGFGGNGAFMPTPPGSEGGAPPGRCGGGCVPNGQFKNMKVNLGPGAATAYNPRCLSRDNAPYFACWYLSKNGTARTMKATDFINFDDIVEGGPGFGISGIHGGGHYGIGGLLGTMGDLFLSPNDPSFWLHHANLDRVWWSWQRLDSDNMYSMGGPTKLMDKTSPPTQLTQPITMGQYVGGCGQAGTVTVNDVMDIRDMCYDYDKYYDVNANNVPPF
ncbi:Tyrosinase [Drechslerella dactyloides]|uniref:Tyrosinase n=1 Tax=Drechslerella dactyloides TaxID=74499 RepID=A0AAD6NFQ5_DREDA|nr:Tyrosinase [Drechslerella dactyloides]